MTELLLGSQQLLDQYMKALDQYGLAQAEMEAVETGSTQTAHEIAADRIEKARWNYVEARHNYKRRKSLRQLSQTQTA